MSLDVQLSKTYFEHESGTKFYEVIVMGVDAKSHIVVTRWGKLNAAGEINIIDATSLRRAEEQAWKVINEKKKRGYFVKESTEGLHGLRLGSWTAATLAKMLSMHYGSKNGRTICEALGVESDELRGKQISGIWIDEASDIVDEKPAPEPERGGTWGSW